MIEEIPILPIERVTEVPNSIAAQSGMYEPIDIRRLQDSLVQMFKPTEEEEAGRLVFPMEDVVEEVV